MICGVNIFGKNWYYLCSRKRIATIFGCFRKKVTSRNARITFYEGTIENIKVITLFCGVCKVNAAIATQILVDKYNVDIIIISGTAGGLDNRLEIGDTVISTEIAYYDVADGILTEYHPWMPDIYFRSDKNLISLCENMITICKLPQSVYFGRIVTEKHLLTKKVEPK